MDQYSRFFLFYTRRLSLLISAELWAGKSFSVLQTGVVCVKIKTAVTELSDSILKEGSLCQDQEEDHPAEEDREEGRPAEDRGLWVRGHLAGGPWEGREE